MLKLAATAGALTVGGERAALAQTKVDQAKRGMPAPIIKDIQVIATAPGGGRMVIVKVITDQAGLYGYGCGTIEMRAEDVVDAVTKYLKPLLVGRPADRIEDTWQIMVNSAQWRFGPILNNAMSGVDQALWDIKGRQVGLPVYELLGGKCREAALAYVHIGGADAAATVEDAHKAIAQGYKVVRTGGVETPPKALWEAGRIDDPALGLRNGLTILEELRKQLGPDIGLCYDIHRNATPNQAIQFAKDTEHLKMFFVEDPFSVEDYPWHRELRAQCSTPIAEGEMFTNPMEYVPLIQERLIDYMRMHISDAGGLTPCRKAAAMGELLGVRTAWHGSGDQSPFGNAAALHLDLAIYNFGIQEWTPYNQLRQDMFPGHPEVKNGYVYANDRPGWGMDVDEKLAAKYPYSAVKDRPVTGRNLNGGWGDYRWPDGTIYRP
jgi:mannonate dehydratase